MNFLTGMMQTCLHIIIYLLVTLSMRACSGREAIIKIPESLAAFTILLVVLGIIYVVVRAIKFNR